MISPLPYDDRIDEIAQIICREMGEPGDVWALFGQPDRDRYRRAAEQVLVLLDEDSEAAT